MAKYKLQNVGSPILGVIDIERNIYIPNDTSNRHWIAFQEWLTQGSPLNIPDPADIFVEDWDNTGRAIRNAKLLATDWTQIPDAQLDYGSPIKRNEFAVYRQELRDLPSTYPVYSNVVWPTIPTL